MNKRDTNLLYSLDNVILTICNYFKVAPEDFINHSGYKRKGYLLQATKWIAYYTYKNKHYSQENIASKLGIDRTTVHYHFYSINKRLSKETISTNLKTIYEDLNNLLEGVVLNTRFTICEHPTKKIIFEGYTQSQMLEIKRKLNITNNYKIEILNT